MSANRLEGSEASEESSEELEGFLGIVSVGEKVGETLEDVF